MKHSHLSVKTTKLFRKSQRFQRLLFNTKILRLIDLDLQIWNVMSKYFFFLNLIDDEFSCCSVIR